MAWSIGQVGVTGDTNERNAATGPNSWGVGQTGLTGPGNPFQQPGPPRPATAGAIGGARSAQAMRGAPPVMRAGMMGTRMPGPSGRFQGGGLRGDIYRGTRGQRFNPGMGNQSMAKPAAINPALQGGVRPGINTMGGPSFGPPGQANAAQIQADMQRRQVGQQLGPRNAAVAGYMMGK